MAEQIRTTQESLDNAIEAMEELFQHYHNMRAHGVAHEDAMGEFDYMYWVEAITFWQGVVKRDKQLAEQAAI